jgi:hypothetical protein
MTLNFFLRTLARTDQEVLSAKTGAHVSRRVPPYLQSYSPSCGAKNILNSPCLSAIRDSLQHPYWNLYDGKFYLANG